VAKQQSSQGADDFTTAYKNFFFDLPLATLRQSLGMGTEKETAEAAWKGYDASVRMATATIDALYRNQLFGDVVSRSLSSVLRWQQVSNTVTGAVFTALWKTLGAPTAAEVQSLSEQMRALESRLSQTSQKKDVQVLLDQLRALEARLHRPVSAPTPLRTNHHEERAAA
jgi:hypothetical protein